MARPAKRARIDTPDDDGSSLGAGPEPQTTSDDLTDATSEIEGDSRIILAISCQRGRVGAAYLDLNRSCLFLLEDSLDTDKHDLAALIVEQVRPKLVLTSALVDDTFTVRIKQTLEAREDAMVDELTVQVRPRAEWSRPWGEASLRQLRVLTASFDDTSSYGARQAGDEDVGVTDLGSLVTADSPVMLGAVGCLFQHYRKSPPAGEMPNPEYGIVEVGSVERIALDKMLHIDAGALSALQIFAEQSHANAYSDRTKQGLSIYGLLDRTCTPTGKLLLRHWLLRPSTELDVIRGRHAAVGCFCEVANDAALLLCRTELRGVKNIHAILRSIKEGKAKGSTWMAVHKFLCAATVISDTLGSLVDRDAVDIIARLRDSFSSDDFRDLATIINQMIDWEESKTQGRVCVKAQVDDELDHLRQEIASLDSKLTHLGEKLSLEIPPEFADSIDLVYFPQLGYLTVVPLKADWEDPAVRAPSHEWEHQFSTETQAFFKNDIMRHCDQIWGDLHFLASARELEIVYTLQLRLEQHFEGQMRRAADCMAEFDVLRAMAEAAREYQWSKPVMTDQNVCRIQNGRHPLVEAVITHYVPNHAVLTGGKGVEKGGENEALRPQADGTLSPDMSILVLTGANGSGKSVYLKAVAIIVFLAHCGSFVPADTALIGLTDAIYTRVSTVESASHDASAFTIDLRQISYMLRNCTNRSLLIIDEFGKGTDSSDGTGLFVGLVEHLVNRGVDTPKSLLATHYHAIFANDLLSRNLPILLTHMELMIQSERDGQRMTITHLFRLAGGLAKTSHAALCAEANGIDPAITARATYVSQLIAQHAVNELLDAAMSDSGKAEMRCTAARVDRFLKLDFDSPDVADDVHSALKRVVEDTLEA